MKIIISQKEKKLEIIFSVSSSIPGTSDKYTINKAEKFLVCVDKLLKKRHTVKVSDFKYVKLVFHNTGLLTERVIRATMLGLRF